MPETMARLRGVFKPIFYYLQFIFGGCLKVSIVSALIFIDSIVSVHRIYERRKRKRGLAAPLVKGFRFAPIPSFAIATEGTSP
jgi:hypothetical protein